MDFNKISKIINTAGYIPLVQIPVAVGHIGYGVVKAAFSSIASAFCKVRHGSCEGWDKSAVDGFQYIGRGLAELVPVVSTVALPIYDHYKAKPKVKVENLFGPLLPLSEENKVFLEGLCAKDKNFAKDFQKLIDYLHDVRKKHLSNPDDHVQNITKDGAKATELFVAILSHLDPTTPEYKKLTDLQFLIMENALIMNNQVHEDYLVYGLLDHTKFDSKSPCLSKLSRQNSFEEKLAKKIQEINDLQIEIDAAKGKKIKELLKQKKEHLEKSLEFTGRNGSPGVSEKRSWENISTSFKATRQIAFRTDSGSERIAQAELDLSSLGAISDDQKIKVMEVLQRYEQLGNHYYHLLAKDKNLTLQRLNKEKARLLAGKPEKYKDSREFKSFMMLIDSVDSLPFLDDAKKNSLVRIASNFSWNINREMNLARIQLGWPQPASVVIKP